MSEETNKETTENVEDAEDEKPLTTKTRGDPVVEVAF